MCAFATAICCIHLLSRHFNNDDNSYRQERQLSFIVSPRNVDRTNHIIKVRAAAAKDMHPEQRQYFIVFIHVESLSPCLSVHDLCNFWKIFQHQKKIHLCVWAFGIVAPKSCGKTEREAKKMKRKKMKRSQLLTIQRQHLMWQLC